MNPLHWKKEHQVALLGAILIGGILGFVYGLQEVPRCCHAVWHLLCNAYGNCSIYLEIGYWLLVAAWGLFGALVAGGVVYVFQLSRA